jgi:sigma-B regulation protein RsbU (phosphoserine phosphatase)
MSPPDDAPGAPAAADDYESAACGLLTVAMGGAIERVNRTFCAWAGYAAGELVGKVRFQDLLTVGSKLFHQTHWMPLLQMQGSVAEVQLEMARRDGRVLAVLVNAAVRPAGPAGPAGPIDVAVFVATDRRKYERELLAARRRAEELLASEREAQAAREQAEAREREREREYRALAENSPDFIARFDREQRYVYVNAAVAGFTGRPAAEFLGRRVGDGAMPPEAARAWSAALDEAFGGRPATISFGYEGRDGVPREFQAHVVPERDAHGGVATALSITRDVTALRQQEREAAQRAQLAEQLVGIVSHDLRNPLNAVLLGANLLEEAELAEPERRLATRIAAAAARANRLIADLLDFTQARLGGGLRVTPREIDLHALVAEWLDELRLAWPGRAIEHRRAGEGAAFADGDRLAQIVSNLANNALTYGTPDEPVTVASAVEPDAIEIRVHNAGPPVPEELRPHIFEPLRRGEQQVRLGSRSVGLGLYIVREIARAHGGRVSLHSAEGEGTTFAVRLPRDPAPRPSEGA